MRVLNNADVEALLDVPMAIAALREAYADLAAGPAAHAPRIDLYAPAAAGATYRWGSMSGIARGAGVVAVRIKSDVVSWDGGVEAKHCIAPGTFSGIVLLYATADGAPLALLHDGVLQHARVGAAVALGADLLAAPDAAELAVLGSGAMARSCAEALAAVRALRSARVYSPDPGHRAGFAAWLGERGIAARACGSAQEAVRGAPLVLSATSALEAPFAAAWLAPGAHVAMVSQREVPDDLHQRVDLVCRLGDGSLPPDLGVPGMEWFRGGYAGYATGDAEAQARIPRRRPAETPAEPTLPALLSAPPPALAGRRTALVAVGTQGLQFAALGAAVLRRAQARGVGVEAPDAWFLQDIRD